MNRIEKSKKSCDYRCIPSFRMLSYDKFTLSARNAWNCCGLLNLLSILPTESPKTRCCNLFYRKLQFFSVIFCDPKGLKSLGFVRRYRKIHQGPFLDRKRLSGRRENSEHFDTSKHKLWKNQRNDIKNRIFLLKEDGFCAFHVTPW